MIRALSLPKAVIIGGVEYRHKTDFREIWNILPLFSDPDFDNEEKALAFLQLFYYDFDKIPIDDYEEAYNKGIKFIDADTPEGGNKIKLMDWEQDAHLIVADVNKSLGYECRSVEYLHWWTFIGAYKNISWNSPFMSVMNIRDKIARHQKLSKEEQRFYRENRLMIDLKKQYTEQEKEMLRELGIKIE